MLEALEVRYAADGSGCVAHDGNHQRLPGWGCIKGAHTKIGGAWRQGRLDDFLIEAVALWRQRHSACTCAGRGSPFDQKTQDDGRDDALLHS